MRSLKTLIISYCFLSFCYSAIAQTTEISFITASSLRTNPGDNFENSGCQVNGFGPNPTTLWGSRIRVVGKTKIYSISSGFPSLALFAKGNVNSGSDYSNSVLSIEYPFKANKTYQIQILGQGADYTTDGNTKPADYINPVLWVKLDNTPEIITNVQDKCNESLSPVEKKVDRYAKLIADNSRNTPGKSYILKFSPLEAKSALKITLDPSPADPSLRYDATFRFSTVKITELPYEEEQSRIIASYTNAPRPPRGTPGYDIEVPPTSPDRGSNPRPGGDNSNIATNFTIPPYQWNTTNGESTFIISNLNILDISNCTVLGAVANPGRSSNRERFNLPTTFKNNNLTYEVIDGDLIIKSKNSDGTPPSIDIDFSILYKEKK